ncbi:hypothetical protein DH2020_025622 [Rehmannia glutinosa]|uniref:FAD-binding FR-type domain-containing protein n=1 Tax=Rehmannia glutinosa TaxID=99300 RepID=A0ABR0W308_REHGL
MIVTMQRVVVLYIEMNDMGERRIYTSLLGYTEIVENEIPPRGFLQALVSNLLTFFLAQLLRPFSLLNKFFSFFFDLGSSPFRNGILILSSSFAFTGILGWKLRTKHGPGVFKNTPCFNSKNNYWAKRPCIVRLHLIWYDVIMAGIEISHNYKMISPLFQKTLFTSSGVTHGVKDDIYSSIVRAGLVDELSRSRANKTQIGEISLLCGLCLWITTYPTIRRNIFELFFYTHYLYIFFIIFFILHIGIGFACIMLPGFYLFLIDRYLRFLQSTQKVRLVSARLLPCDTVELNFSKTPSLNYSPTSTMFINVPSISKLQWHPFTITSNNKLEPERLSVVIKCEGNWTKKLYDVVSSPSSIIDRRLQVSVEGPYGPASTNFLRHDMVVMISGGSGITPFISIIKELIFIGSTLKCKTPKIILITVFKNSSNLSILDLILPISGTPSNSCNLDVQIEAYVTREKGHPKDKLLAPRAVWFKPSPSDKPISPTLGPNSWLWLAAIISSSFIIYLVLLGIFTQYVVYPIDQNTNKLYSYTKKGSMNMLFICFSIVIAASGAFLWNKKQNAKEAKQIQDSEESVNSRSSNSSFGPDDIEMESLPLQSTIKSINVHYGQRPNLKRMLLEIKESSVGALVSGPKQMRQDVAAICSSRTAHNLHFESISFTW